MLHAILAVAKNGVVGHGNGMAWHLPEDLKHFKSTTQDSPVLVGRTTYEGLAPYFKGEVLPGRLKRVLSRRPSMPTPSVEFVSPERNDWEKWQQDEEVVWVIGGPTVWKEAWPHLSKVVLTRLDDPVQLKEDSVFFIPNLLGWTLEQSRRVEKNERHFCGFAIEFWTRSQ